MELHPPHTLLRQTIRGRGNDGVWKSMETINCFPTLARALGYRSHDSHITHGHDEKEYLSKPISQNRNNDAQYHYPGPNYMIKVGHAG
jgi:hypothetical protein